MRVLLCLLLATAWAAAQDTKKPVFEVPEKTAGSGDDARAEEDSLDRTLARLAGFPQERARRAAERLIVQKEKSLPRIVNILVSAKEDDAPLKPGAAYVLGRIGDPSQFMILLHVAVEREQQRHADVFLEAAWRLNEKEAVAEAFRFFSLSETTLRNEAVKFVLDRVGPANLPAIHDLLDRRRSPRPFTREIGLRLLDRLVQTGQLKWEDVSLRFYAALGDESPSVSSRAMRLLASRNEPANVAALNNEITKEMSYWRKRSYAALALSILSSAFKEQPFTPEAVEVLRGPKGLRHPKEQLARASAALALAQIALRTSDRDLVRLLDREIPITLIDAVGASHQHYRDFGTVMPLAYAMLRRITGQNFPDQAPKWAAWWRDNQRTFRAKRELIEVSKDDLPETIIELTPPVESGGTRLRLVAVGSSRPTFLYGTAVAVTLADMDELIGVLRGQGFFGSVETRGEVDDGTALVMVRVGDLDRCVAFRKGERLTPKRDAVIGALHASARRYEWQHWWDIDAQPSWDLFFATNRRWFAEHKDEAEQQQRLRAMIGGALDDLPDESDRLRAAETVAAMPGGGAALEPAVVGQFVAAVQAETAANRFTAAVVDLLVPAAGKDAADQLVGALADKTGPRAQAMLVGLCGRLEPEHVGRLAADPRWKVRRAALGALAGLDIEFARPILRARLEDEEVGVRAAAAVELARHKDQSVMPVLKQLAADETNTTVREQAAYAYGLIGGSSGLAGAGRLLYKDPSSVVRIGAVRGLIEGGDKGAPRMLVNVFAKETDVSVRAAAARGLVDLETPELIREITERLELTQALDPERVALVNVLARFHSDQPLDILRRVIQGDDTYSADAAALGLARRWDETSIDQLIKMVKNGRNPRIAVRHLQILASAAFDTPSYERQAENYSGWWRTNSTGNPRKWFVDELDRLGYDTKPFREFAEHKKAGPGPVTDEMVPVLLSGLRAKEWYIQRNASYLLSERIGRGAPDEISYDSTEEEIETSIRAYYDWWNALTKSKEDREKG